MTPSRDDTRFRHIGELGQGGTALVTRVFDKQLGREVALKSPRFDSPDEITRFASLVRREVELIGGHRYPGLVRILDHAVKPSPYLVLELCTGPTLEQLGRIDDLNLALNIFTSLALNLEYMNALGLVHGDLKPHNIFLPQEISALKAGRAAYTKLADFSMGVCPDRPGDVRLGLGTVGYMAPETITVGLVHHRSDLFALGVIAYQMLSGQHPFIGEESEPVKINARVLEEEPANLLTVRPEVGEELSLLVHSLLSKKPFARTESAALVCQKLQEIGATYPWRRLLRPGHLIQIETDYDKTLIRFFDLAPGDRARLEETTSGDKRKLHLTADENHRRGILHYGQGKFVALSSFHWPARLRRDTLNIFRTLSLQDRKSHVLAAALGGIGRVSTLKKECTNELLPGLARLLEPLLRVSTIKRLATRYAPVLERSGDVTAAASVYCRAGDLEQAERCALESAIQMQKSLKSDEGLALLNEVISFAQTADQTFSVRELLMIKGDLLKEQGDLERAIATYREVTELYDDHSPDKLLAKTHKQLGEAFRQQQKSSESLVALEQARSLYEEIGDELEVSHVLNNIGNVHFLLADHTAALSSYRSALHIQKLLGSKSGIASSLGNIASIYCIMGRLTRGIKLLRASLERKKEVAELGDVARTLNNLGYAYHMSGRADLASDCLAESLEINRKIGSKKEILFNLQNLTVLMIASGKLKESLSIFREGLEITQGLGDRSHHASLSIGMATVLKRMGRYDEATAALTLAETILSEIDGTAQEFQRRVQQASIRHHLGKSSGALELVLETYAHAVEKQESSSQMNSLLLITRLIDDTTYFAKAESLIDEMDLKREKLLLHFGVAERLHLSGHTHRAAEMIRPLMDEVSALEADIERPWMLNLCAEMLIGENDLERAGEILTRSAELAQASGLVPELITCLTLQGQIALEHRDWESGYAHYRQALAYAKKIVELLSKPEDRNSYQNRRDIAFLAAAITKLNSRMKAREKAS